VVSITPPANLTSKVRHAIPNAHLRDNLDGGTPHVANLAVNSQLGDTANLAAILKEQLSPLHHADAAL
jgi:hypothetical protein